MGRCFVLFDCLIDMYVSNICKKIVEYVNNEWIKIICGSGYVFI